jgi:hypothetical protein
MVGAENFISLASRFVYNVDDWTLEAAIPRLGFRAALQKRAVTVVAAGRCLAHALALYESITTAELQEVLASLTRKRDCQQ